MDLTQLSDEQSVKILEKAFYDTSIERYSTILNMVLEGHPLGEILNALVLIIEAQKIGTRASVLLLSEDGKCLLTGAAPNLPSEYNDAINGVVIGEFVGSCGAAAFTCQRVIVDDIETHPNWTLYKHLPLKAGLKACWSEPIKDSNHKVLGTFAMYYDTTKSPTELDLLLIQEAARLASLAIERSRSLHVERLSSKIFNSLPISLVITNEHNVVLSSNPIFEQFTPAYDSVQKTFDVNRFLSHSDPRVVQVLFEHLSRGHAWKGELIGMVKDNELAEIDLTVTVIRDSFTKQNCFAWLITDISGKKAADRIIDFQQNYDHLTGLANRRLLFSKLQQRMEFTAGNNQCSLLLLNIDHFKQVNDSLGHDNGDALLKNIAQRIQGNIPEDALLARMGSDEFAILIPQCAESMDLESLCMSLNIILAGSVALAEHNVMISASIGVACFPQDACTVEQVINCASQAMYSAKSKGRNCYEFFNLQIQKVAERKAQLHLLLKKAIINQDFELYYQPIVNPFTGNITKAEVLLRWQHEGQFIAPDEFIPVAEQSGLIVQLGEWVRTQAVKTALELQALTLSIPLSINVSTLEFWSTDLQQRFLRFFDDVLLELNVKHFPYHLITLEITESLMMKQQQQINELLGELRERGIRISVDDFGTGYSSLSYLANFPVDQIKIDKSFIQKLAAGKRHQSLVEAIVSMSRALNLTIVAEGVETQFELDFIKQQNIHAVQGYYFYRPMPKDKFLELLSIK